MNTRTLAALIGVAFLASCAGTDIAQGVAAADVTYSKIAAPLAADAIKSGKLGASDVAHVKAMNDQVHDALKDATTDLAACPVAAGVIDKSCAGGAAVKAAYDAAVSALGDLMASLAAKGFNPAPAK